MNWNDKVALITGGGRRVGSALVLALAKRGVAVAIHYNESAEGAENTASRARSAGAKAEVFPADLSRPASIDPLVDGVLKRFGRLDFLVNSAAIMERTPFGRIDAAVWDRIFAINLRAPFLMAQAAAPHLSKHNGSIVNIADLAAFETWPGYIPHGLTKSAIVHMTRSLARVLAPDVRVNAIAPGTVLLPENFSEQDAAHLNETTPLKRSGTPEDVAAALLFLLEAEYITGETIIVDGGRHVRR